MAAAGDIQFPLDEDNRGECFVSSMAVRARSMEFRKNRQYYRERLGMAHDEALAWRTAIGTVACMEWDGV